MIELLAHGFHHRAVLLHEPQNLFQHGIQLDTLARECQIGEAHLRIGVSHVRQPNQAVGQARSTYPACWDIEVCRRERNDASRGYRMDIFQLVRQNLQVMPKRTELLDRRIQSIKEEIAALGDLRPGAMSLQYNICGNPSCRCKADPPLKHGPYPQVSSTWHGKSSSLLVRQEHAAEVSE